MSEQFKILNRWTSEVIVTAEITCAPDTPYSVKLGLAVRWAIKAGANLAGANLAGVYLAGANLAGANLAGANLAGAYLARANLDGANLARANLAGAYLARANLDGANLARANLDGAYLTRANLAGVYLARANLDGAYLTRANLAGVYLAGANIDGANLAGAYLSPETLRPFIADLWLTLSSLRAGPVEALHLIHKLQAGEVDGSTYDADNGCACLVGTIAQARRVEGGSLDHSSSRPAERWFMMIRPGDKPGRDEDGTETGGGFAARMALAWVRDWCVAHGIDPDAQVAA